MPGREAFYQDMISHHKEFTDERRINNKICPMALRVLGRPYQPQSPSTSTRYNSICEPKEAPRSRPDRSAFVVVRGRTKELQPEGELVLGPPLLGY